MSDRFERLEKAVMDTRVRAGLLAIGHEEMGKDFRATRQVVVEFARQIEERMQKMSARCDENAALSRGIILGLSEQTEAIRGLAEENRSVQEQIAENRRRIEELEAS